MNETNQRTVVAEWFRLLAEGDFDGMHALHTDDIVWDVLPGPSEGIVPWLGHFEGREGVDDCLKRFANAVESEGFETGTVLMGEDDTVAVLGRTDLVARKNGQKFAIEFVEFFRFRDNKIAYVRVFGDTVAARDVFAGASAG